MPENKMKFCPWCGNRLKMFEISGKERSICSDARCGYVFWNNPAPVVAAIVEHNGNVILVRSHGWPEGWFGLVTGFLEKGEMPETAVLREVKEETGLDGKVGAYIGMYPFYERNQLIIAYHVLSGGGEILLDSDELEDYREVPIEKVKPWPMGTGAALRDWLRTLGYEREFSKSPRL
ncbi:MAG: NUDIX hydrolase [Deltaproteobacteria bacterium]|nr:NUDIX hydrolase [Deltaproteobacteria bacterium]